MRWKSGDEEGRKENLFDEGQEFLESQGKEGRGRATAATRTTLAETREREREREGGREREGERGLQTARSLSSIFFRSPRPSVRPSFLPSQTRLE